MSQSLLYVELLETQLLFPLLRDFRQVLIFAAQSLRRQAARRIKQRSGQIFVRHVQNTYLQQQIIINTLY